MNGKLTNKGKKWNRTAWRNPALAGQWIRSPATSRSELPYLMVWGDTGGLTTLPWAEGWVCPEVSHPPQTTCEGMWDAYPVKGCHQRKEEKIGPELTNKIQGVSWTGVWRPLLNIGRAPPAPGAIPRPAWICSQTIVKCWESIIGPSTSSSALVREIKI